MLAESGCSLQLTASIVIATAGCWMAGDSAFGFFSRFTVRRIHPESYSVLTGPKPFPPDQRCDDAVNGLTGSNNPLE